MRTGMTKPAFSIVVLAAVLLTMPVAAKAQQAHFGGRAGFNAEGNAGLLGVQFSLPIAHRLELYPSFDVYFPDRGSLLGFNGDLKYRIPTSNSLWVYGGGGLGVQYVDVDGANDSDLGVNLLGGIETRLGRVHPFLESRVMLYDDTSFQLMGGLNITLYGNW